MMTILQQLLPIQRDSYLLCLQHLGCQCRTCTCTPRRSLSECLVSPSTRLLHIFSCRPLLFSLATVSLAIVELVHLRDNVEWSYAYNQSLGNSERRLEPRGLQQQGNGLVHHPTSVVSKRRWQSTKIETHPLVPESSTPVHHLEEVVVLSTPEPI